MRLILVLLGLLAASVAIAEPRQARNLSYGPAPENRLDLHTDTSNQAAPVLVMLHGGGWKRGSKSMPGVWKNRVAWWVPRGYVFVSVETRLLPQARPDEQVRDFARAVAFVQANAASWGGDASRVVLMGHSAGAHIAALLAGDGDLRRSFGIAPLRGAVALDSGALDLEAVMTARHFELYDDAFGADPAYWAQVSPIRRLSSDTSPVLAVCSSRRLRVCGEARDYARAAAGKGVRVTVMPVALSHGRINGDLGQPSPYTEAVSDWIADKVR